MALCMLGTATFDACDKADGRADLKGIFVCVCVYMCVYVLIMAEALSLAMAHGWLLGLCVADRLAGWATGRRPEAGKGQRCKRAGEPVSGQSGKAGTVEGRRGRMPERVGRSQGPRRQPTTTRRW